MRAAQNSNSGLSRWIKTAAYLLLILIILLAATRLALKSEWVHDRVKDYILETANEQLTGELGIEKLSGDLWSSITLSKVTLVKEDTIATVDTLRMAYDITSYFGDAFDIRRIELRRPAVSATEEDGTWNMADLTAPSPGPEEPSEPFAFRIHEIEISDGFVRLSAPSVLADTSLQVTDVSLNGNFSWYGDLYDAQLQSLSFRLKHTRLDQPVAVETAASADEKEVTLERLVLASGRSLVKTSGNINRRDSALALRMQGEPVAWQDIAEFSRNMPLVRDLKVDLGIHGTLSDFEVGLGVRAAGLDSLQLTGGVTFDSTFSLQLLKLNVGRLDPSLLFGDTTMPAVDNIRVAFTGRIPFNDYREGNGKITWSMDEIRRPPYLLSAVRGDMELQSGSISGRLNAQNGRQQLVSFIEAKQIWSEQPVVSVKLDGREIDPAYWAKNGELEGEINFTVTASGKGWYPQQERWDYRLDVQDSRIGRQPLDTLSLNGKFNRRSATANGFVRLIKSRLELDAAAGNLTGTPEFDFKFLFDNFDLSEVAGAEDYATALSGEVIGAGKGSTPGSLQLTSAVRFDSTIINGELIRQLSGKITVRDTVAIIGEARLISTIADGSFDARIHLLRRYDRDNRLDFNLQVKELQSLAPLAGADSLQAEGDIEGTLNPAGGRELRFSGDMDLQNLVYNQTFQSERARGNMEIIYREHPVFKLDLLLTRPAFPSVVLQDLRLTGTGNLLEESTEGGFTLEFTGTGDGEIVHAGSFQRSSDTVRVETTRLDITGSQRTLSLQRPFSVVVANRSVKMDTMRVVSGDGAFLELAIPYADSARQTGYLKGESLNTTVIQNSLLSEVYFEGILSGELQFTRADTLLEAAGDLTFSEFNYRDTRFGTLTLSADIAEERLQGSLSVRDGGKAVIEGKADLPFRPGDPKKFEQAFFAEPVSGYLDIRQLALSRFEQLLEESGIENTEGLLSFRGTLKGSAGEPEFRAGATLKEALVSGVSLDSVTANLHYRNDLSMLDIHASVISLRQKAAQINAEIPLHVDFRTFEVTVPGEDDPIAADITMDGFNLAALNDFLDRSRLRSLEGELNGKVQVKGRTGSLQPEGRLVLRNGSVRLVPAGITVDRIRSELIFRRDLLRLSGFSARSGRGELNAEGQLELEELVPGDMDIRVTAENFRAANTAGYNALVNMDLRSAGTFRKPEISGNVSFINGFVELDNFGEKSVEAVELDSPGTEEPEVSLYDSLSLDMNVSFNRRFFIRNQRYLEMEIELEGELDLVKEGEKPLQLFGTMNAPGGYARPLGKRFELQEGSVTFTGEAGNPELAVRTRYSPPQTKEDILIWYIIGGTVEDPTFKYESDPQMELENIISYTLFGQPFYALDSWKQVVASSGSNTTPTDMALEVLLDRVEALATQRLGIDVVQIDNTRQGGENATSITTGWYLNPRVFFAVQNVIAGSTPDTGFLLEYLLKKNLKLIIRQGNSTHQGVDLRWNFDY